MVWELLDFHWWKESIGLGKQKVQGTVQEVEELPVSAGSPVVLGHLSQVSACGHRAEDKWAAHGVASFGQCMVPWLHTPLCFSVLWPRLSA